MFHMVGTRCLSRKSGKWRGTSEGKPLCQPSSPITNCRKFLTCFEGRGSTETTLPAKTVLIIKLQLFQIWKQIHLKWKVTCLYQVFTHISSLLTEKDICDRQNISVKLPCVCVPFIWRSLHFFGKNFLFLFLFLYFECVIKNGKFLIWKSNCFQKFSWQNLRMVSQ